MKNKKNENLFLKHYADFINKIKKTKIKLEYEYEPVKEPSLFSDKSFVPTFNNFFSILKKNNIYDFVIRKYFDNKIPMISNVYSHKNYLSENGKISYPYNALNIFEFLSKEFNKLEVLYIDDCVFKLYNENLKASKNGEYESKNTFQDLLLSDYNIPKPASEFKILFKYKEGIFYSSFYFNWKKENYIGFVNCTVDYLYNELSEFYNNFTKLTKIFEKYNNVSIENADKQKSQVYIVNSDMAGFYLRNFEIETADDSIIKNNYNDDLIEFDKKIKNYLNNSKKGIIFLDGEKGTGKTYYIKNLINSVDKKFIFFPSSLRSYLTETKFFNFLLSHCKNSVFIFEDAEELIKSREDNGGNGAISDLLNISDGIISDIFKTTIIMTFNTDIKNIDKALMRENRLIGEYNFKKLESKKSKMLIKNLKKKEPKDINDTQYTLSQIYALDNEKMIYSDRNNVSKIGFKTKK
jgi:hypothetical protein